MISDGMIIQRDCSFPIWTPSKISISFLNKNYESEQIDDKWLITLDPVAAGGPFTMEITDGKNTKVIKDIYAGDLWLCAGQSNMEMPMARLKDNYKEEWTSVSSEQGAVSSGLSLIRQFKVPQEWDFSAPRDFLTGGSWVQVSKESLDDFTAVGWFFAKYLYKKYQETEGQTVPIGLINTAWGGTPIESWMSKEALYDYPNIIADGEQYAAPGKIKEIQNQNAYAILEWENNVKNEDVGFPLEWEKPETDISAWDEMLLPGSFYTQSKDEELKDFCGSVWLAKDFELSEEFAKSDAKVWLGTIIDADTVYLNGKEIGNTGYRYPPRKYSASGFLKHGINRIVIRITVNNGQGAVTPDNPFYIFTEKEKIDLSGTWKYKIGTPASERPEEFFFHYKPIGNYNAMIHPVLKHPLKGVIWYQGESNESRPHEYADLFQKMILNWRKNNNNDKLPFLFVQLPVYLEPSDNCETHSWALIREAQASALSLPYTGMAAAWEHGEWNDIHPVNKKDVGYRLFLAAEKLLFGIENTSPGPMVERWEKKDDKLYIYFNNYGTGLIIKEILTQSTQRKEKDLINPLRSSAFEIEAKDCISIDLSSLKDKNVVLYSWANNPVDRSLYNSEGLPVLPFKINL